MSATVALFDSIVKEARGISLNRSNSRKKLSRSASSSRSLTLDGEAVTSFLNTADLSNDAKSRLNVNDSDDSLEEDSADKSKDMTSSSITSPLQAIEQSVTAALMPHLMMLRHASGQEEESTPFEDSENEEEDALGVKGNSVTPHNDGSPVSQEDAAAHILEAQSHNPSRTASVSASGTITYSPISISPKSFTSEIHSSAVHAEPSELQSNDKSQISTRRRQSKRFFIFRLASWICSWFASLGHVMNPLQLLRMAEGKQKQGAIALPAEKYGSESSSDLDEKHATSSRSVSPEIPELRHKQLSRSSKLETALLPNPYLSKQLLDTQARIRNPIISNPSLPQSLLLAKSKILVLDLDETLIHSTSRSPGYGRAPGVGGGSKAHLVEVVLDGRSVLYHVYKRPFVDYFLKKVATWYTLVIFTASLPEYADPVIDHIDGGRGLFSRRLFRDSCSPGPRGTYLKDLATLEHDLSRVALIDNSPTSHVMNPANAIPIAGWVNDPSDQALLDLLPFLDSLRFMGDVRSVLGLRGFSLVPTTLSPTK